MGIGQPQHLLSPSVSLCRSLSLSRARALSLRALEDCRPLSGGRYLWRQKRSQRSFLKVSIFLTHRWPILNRTEDRRITLGCSKLTHLSSETADTNGNCPGGGRKKITLPLEPAPQIPLDAKPVAWLHNLAFSNSTANVSAADGSDSLVIGTGDGVLSTLVTMLVPTRGSEFATRPRMVRSVAWLRR